MGRVYLAWQFGEEFRRRRKEDYRWSSARAHLQGEDDILVKAEPEKEIVRYGVPRTCTHSGAGRLAGCRQAEFRSAVSLKNRQLSSFRILYFFIR